MNSLDLEIYDKIIYRDWVYNNENDVNNYYVFGTVKNVLKNMISISWEDKEFCNENNITCDFKISDLVILSNRQQFMKV